MCSTNEVSQSHRCRKGKTGFFAGGNRRRRCHQGLTSFGSVTSEPTGEEQIGLVSAPGYPTRFQTYITPMKLVVIRLRAQALRP